MILVLVLIEGRVEVRSSRNGDLIAYYTCYLFLYTFCTAFDRMEGNGMGYENLPGLGRRLASILG